MAYTLDPSTGIYIDPVSGATSMDPLGQTAVTNPSLVQQAKRNLAVSHGLLDTLGKYGQQFDQSISGEQALSQHLNEVIAGAAPSVAQEQEQQGLGQIRQQLDSQASGASGANAGLARLTAIQAGGALSAKAVQDAALLRAQEQAAAVQNQGAVLGNMAGQAATMYGTGVSGASAFGGQAANLAAQQAQIDEQRREANLRLITNLAAAGGAGLATLATGGAGPAAAAAAGATGGSSGAAPAAAAPMPVASASPGLATEQLSPLDATLAGAGATGLNNFTPDSILGPAPAQYEGPDINRSTGLSTNDAYTSDERAKTDVVKAPMDQFLDHLAGFYYSYKHSDPMSPAGQRIGPMAQDVQKGGPIGRSIASGDPDGPAPMRMDIPNSVGAALAAVGYLNEQIKELKSKKAA